MTSAVLGFSLFFLSGASRCSGVSLATELPSSDVYLAAARLVDPALYELRMINVSRTRFFILGRKHDGLKIFKVERAIRKFWPKLQKQLRSDVAEAAIIDFEGPLGGGPLGTFVVGVYTSTVVSKDHGKLIRAATGWELLESSWDYIRKYYGEFTDPEQAYIDDMVAHELGHLFFGFGRTQAPLRRPEELWFSFGLGLIYDRMVWNSLNARPSPLFEAVVLRWENEFSKNKEVDQRLVGPDTSRDQAWGISRLQTYGHGKALIYLTKLRERIGYAEFDGIVREYLKRPVGSEISYGDFLKFLPQKYRSLVQKTEQEFLVR